LSPEQPTPIRAPSLIARIDWGMLIVGMVSLGAAITVLMQEGLDVSLAILSEDALLLLTILPKVMLGCLIGALIRVLIPKEVIERHIGHESGLRGITIAALMGMLFPAGPFTIFPLAAVLLLSGADRGAAIAFISGWLLLGINRAIIWEMPFFGTEFVMLRFLVSLPLPVLMGMLARHRIFDRIDPPSQNGDPSP
jgi:uncharacterized membrane protein YraQ (UPF0718 family)